MLLFYARGRVWNYFSTCAGSCCLAREPISGCDNGVAPSRSFSSPSRSPACCFCFSQSSPRRTTCTLYARRWKSPVPINGLSSTSQNAQQRRISLLRQPTFLQPYLSRRRFRFADSLSPSLPQLSRLQVRAFPLRALLLPSTLLSQAALRGCSVGFSLNRNRLLAETGVLLVSASSSASLGGHGVAHEYCHSDPRISLVDSNLRRTRSFLYPERLNR
jgi:hypothetical protein